MEFQKKLFLAFEINLEKKLGADNFEFSNDFENKIKMKIFSYFLGISKDRKLEKDSFGFLEVF